jgi:DNA-3-methyladenine glycosylase I
MTGTERSTPSPAPLRCRWAAGENELMLRYHDEEWGVPVHDDRRLFEMILLEGAQAGLSWATVLGRREGYRRGFAKFDPLRVAAFDERDRRRLLEDPGIIRNRAKIDAAIGNAKAFLEVQEEHGSFDRFLWDFVGGKPRTNRFRDLGEVPASTDTSKALSRELKRRGFRFVGPTIVYAFMQAVGVVNDHTVDCFRHAELASMEESVLRTTARHAPAGCR